MHLGPYHYRVGGRRITLRPTTSTIAARYDDQIPRDDRAGIAQQEAGVGPILARYEVPAEKLTIYPITPPPGRDVSTSIAITRLDSASSVVRAAQVYQLGDKRVVATDRILVRLEKGQAHRVQSLVSMGFEYLAEIDGTFVFRLPSTEDPLEVASRISALDWVQYAEPDLVTIGERPQVVTIGGVQALQAGRQQYAMTITQADLAWNACSGAPSIRIAILDDGVDTTHPSLAGSIVDAYDAIYSRPGSLPNSWDTHGTACAGIAAATPARSSDLRGVASGCSILAVRIAQSPARGQRWSTASSYIASGIDWAVRRGADVLSCSWGGGAPSSVIVEALGRARLAGRAGKGCVIVAAAGNDSASVDFPGNVVGVLAVSGTNEYDEFKTPYTHDGENWWGSNFGPQVDIAAPSVHIYTADVVGPGGDAPGDFVTGFNGTSAATPFVAGAAALILSGAASLSESDVRRAIRDGADKVGQYPYADLRNDYLGYGRLNVRRALELASTPTSPSPTPPLPPANVLRGTLRQVNVGGRRLAAFYLLDQDGQSVYLLKIYGQDASDSAEALETQNLAYLARLADRAVEVQYSARQSTADGTILWGVEAHVVGSTDGTTGTIGDQPPPSEVRMGYVEAPSEPLRDEATPCVPLPWEVCLG